MLIVSRNRLFDAWDWPPVLFAVFGSGLLLIVFAAILLQQRTRQAKQAALEHLDQKLLERFKNAPWWKPASDDVLNRELRRQIEAFDGITFQSWHQNPIFRAILIPLGGVGSLQMLERFNSIF
jgi:hypothetical protein